MSQTNELLTYLENHPEGATPLEIWKDLRIYRASGRVHDLRKQGHDVKTDIVEVDGARVARYWLCQN